MANVKKDDKGNNTAEDFFGKVTFSYTLDEAENDGVLCNISAIDERYGKGVFSHITVALLHRGYIDKPSDNESVVKLNIPNLFDLLSQTYQFMSRMYQDGAEIDWFYSGEIELPNGEKQKVFSVRNEIGKFTIMLPEDY